MLIGVYLIEDEINSLITNKISLKNLKEFSFIIGATPSKGARSPILWNKVYNYQDNQNLICVTSRRNATVALVDRPYLKTQQKLDLC